MDINKWCKYGGSPFIAQKMSTQFRSYRCADISYKIKKRIENLGMYFDGKLLSAQYSVVY